MKLQHFQEEMKHRLFDLEQNLSVRCLCLCLCVLCFVFCGLCGMLVCEGGVVFVCCGCWFLFAHVCCG